MFRPESVFKFLMIVFGAIGLILLTIGGVLFLLDRSFISDAERAEGIVVELVRRGRWGMVPVVEFRADDRTIKFVGSVSSNPPAFSVGDRVTVLYPPGRPEQARIDSVLERWFPALLLGGLGVIFGVLGLVFGLVRVVGRRRRERVLTLGTPVKARVTAVELDTRIRVNRRHPWRLRAEFEDRLRGTGKHECVSHGIWTDPTPHYPVGSEVTVYYLPDEPGRTAFVLEKMGESAPQTFGPLARA